MKQAIWKYPLSPGENYIKMPGRARPLAVGWQGEQLCLWCVVQPGEPEKALHFFVAMTGQDLPDDPGPYVGSAESSFGIVAHVFRIFKEVACSSTIG